LAIDDAQWFALWTHSHCEQLVRDQLSAKGFDTFLPTVGEWSRRGGVRRVIPRPMFPSYLFVRHAMEKRSYVEIMKARGLVRILGERWDRLCAIGDGEIEAIQQVGNSGKAVVPYPYLREGQRVRIIEGPLAGVEGILVRNRPKQGLLVLSVDLLQRSVAVEIECDAVAPVEKNYSGGFRLQAEDAAVARLPPEFGSHELASRSQS
jgi:transcription termination/antitermination protein NusG